MIIRVNSPDISGNEKTLLTSSAVAGATTLTVQNIEGFAVNNYLVLGTLGDEGTELVQVSSGTPPATSIITLASATTFNHAVNTPVTYIPFNQVALYSATSKTGTYNIVGSATALEVDQDYTEISDSTGGTTTWYKTRYYYSTAPAVWSSYSGVIKGTGYTQSSLKKILEKSNALTDDKDNSTLTEDEKIDIINDGYEQVINKLEKADHKRFVKKGYVDITNSYNTGTVAVTDGATAVVGTSTVWVNTWTGKKIIFEDEGFPYEVASVTDGTNLVLTRAYNGAGSNLSGDIYKIFQDEYTLYDESTGVAIADFKKIEQVVDEDGVIVNEYDLHRTEAGYYLKREGDNLKFCLNFQPSTSDAAGKWTIWYRYQPAKMDTMEDEPEFPQGYSSLLVSYLCAKIRERQEDLQSAAYYIGEFTALTNKLIREVNPRTNEKKGFRLDKNINRTYEHDEDWIEDVYSRETISGTQWS
jgi:hypothetical protein